MTNLLVPGERQVLVVVADGLLVVAEAVVGVAEEVAGLGLALHVAQLLAQHEVVLVEWHGLWMDVRLDGIKYFQGHLPNKCAKFVIAMCGSRTFLFFPTNYTLVWYIL